MEQIKEKYEPRMTSLQEKNIVELTREGMGISHIVWLLLSLKINFFYRILLTILSNAMNKTKFYLLPIRVG